MHTNTRAWSSRTHACSRARTHAPTHARAHGTHDAPHAPQLMWPAYLCAFVDYLGLSISIPILPYFVLELGWDSVGCPEVPPRLAAATARAGHCTPSLPRSLPTDTARCTHALS